MTAIPILAFWAIAFWGLRSHKPVLLWLLVLTLPLGSVAVLPPAITGGLTLLPATMTAMLICVREFALRRSGIRNLSGLLMRFDRGLLLFLFWLVALIVTLFMPRIFAGEIQVVPMRGGVGYLQTTPLMPSQQNFSQLAYITVSIAATFALCNLLRRDGLIDRLPHLWMTGSMVTIGTGVLDLMAQFLPIGPILAPFRTATYALLTDVELADGSTRIIGLMPEASSYGSICLTFLSVLYFLRSSFESRKDRQKAGLISILLMIFLIMSTSSAAYVGLAALGALAVFDWWRRASRMEKIRSARRGVVKEFALAVALVGALAATILFVPRVLDPIMERIEDRVLNKTASSSFEERSMWTRTAYEAGMASHMIGIGIGSVRASNSIAAVFGTTGLLGVILYYAFQLKSLVQPLPPHTDSRKATIAKAFRWSFWATFLVSILIGTSPDFGVTGALRWGVLLALCMPPLLRPDQRAPLARETPLRRNR